MSTSYLLDSSVLILLLRQDVKIRKRYDEATAVHVSAIALGELYYGAKHSVHVERSVKEVDDMAQTVALLRTDDTTATIYGQIKHEQRMKGQMLPDNDLWIAATAIQYGLTLAARDHHFTWIADLSLEQW